MNDKINAEITKQESSIADIYIKKMERHYQRPLPPLTKFLIKNFVKTLEGQRIQGTPKRKDGGKTKVAMIMQSVGYFTGGRYYAWFIAMALVELGFEVTVYTDRESGFYSDVEKFYKQPAVEIIVTKPRELQTIDVEADIYIGVPVYGNMAAINLSQKYSKPAYVMVFDPFNMMEKYLGYSYEGWEELKFLIAKNKVNVISLCHATSEYIYPWLNKKKEEVFEIYPCINSREKDSEPHELRKEDYVVFVSRIVEHKKFDHVLDAVKATGLRLKVISSLEGADTRRLIKKKGMEDKVDLYFRCTDKEKFNVIYGARAMINGAIFEGFGMWAAEAISVGLPLVCYNYPSLTEIAEFAGAKNVYFAKHNDPEDLTKQLKIALEEGKFTEGSHAFDFEALIKRVGEVFTFNPRIGVVTIALNEEQFIGSALHAVVKHPNIKRVAVVEGADNLFAHAATDKGLSLDKTQDKVFQAMQGEFGEKIVYERHGWATDKSELRNRALELLGRDIDYVLVVDADEVWQTEELDRLVSAMKQNRNIGVLAFGFYHFFKNIKQVATGGQWNSYMFRCFKFSDKNLRWRDHNLPVVNEHGEYIQDSDGILRLDDVHVHHLGYVKEDKRIEEKLEYYNKRDPHLKVETNWKDWKEGDPSSFTHHTGEVSKFEGEYPEEFKELFKI